MAKFARSEEERRFDEAVGRRIAQLRKQRKITGAALARAIGVTQGRLYFIETGSRCPVFLVRKIAAVLDVSPSNLI